MYTQIFKCWPIQLALAIWLTSLFINCWRGDKITLLPQSENSPSIIKPNMFPLHQAAAGDLATLDCYLKQDYDVNTLNELGQNPLHIAIAHRQEEMLQRLLKAGANINWVDKIGLLPLHYAVANGWLEVVTLLVEKGANPETIEELSDLDPPSPLMLAIKDRNFLTIKYLLSKTKNINYPDKDGDTALHMAVSSEDVALVKCLLVLSANEVKRNVRNNNEITPLHIASLHANPAILLALLNFSSAAYDDLLIQDIQDNTLFHNAVIKGMVANLEYPDWSSCYKL